MNVSSLQERREKRKSILIVDDYMPSRHLLTDILGQSGDYEIGEASNGVEALELFKSFYHDMVITDVNMPLMDGLELLDAIREIKPSTAIIMITAYPAVDLSVSAIKRGAVDFLKKPFNIKDLLFKVGLYLNEGDVPKDDDGQNGIGYLKKKENQLSLQSYVYEAIENVEGGQEEIFQKVVELALKVVEGETCGLFLYDEVGRTFHPKVIKSDDGSEEHDQMPVVTNLFEDVVSIKDALMIHSDDNPLIAPSMICVPLLIRNNVFGVLTVKKKKNVGLFTKNDLHLVVSLAKRASLNLENKVLYDSMYDNLLDTFKSLVASIQVRDNYTEEHCQRVARVSARLAQECGCSPRDIESLRIASLIHDVGKIAWPDSVLLKPGRLTDDEYRIVKNHPVIGEKILSPVLLLDKEREITLYHHERWDGKGYPYGLSGNAIPLLSRIISVADTFDAMVSDRPYRNGLSLDAAMAELEKNRYTQFDGEIVDIFIEKQDIILAPHH